MRLNPAVAVTVAVIVVTTLLSGPAISAVDLTGTGSFEGTDLGDGRVAVGNVSLPETVAIERGEFGSGSYYLRVPSATVELREVVGRPILSYQISIDDLSFTRSGVHVLSASNEGTYELTLEERSFGVQEIQNDSYAAELSITARYADTERVVASRNVTIEVRE